MKNIPTKDAVPMYTRYGFVWGPLLVERCMSVSMHRGKMHYYVLTVTTDREVVELVVTGTGKVNDVRRRKRGKK